MQAIRGGLQPFDRQHLAAVGFDAEHQARVDRLAVDENGARAAVADVAAFLGAGEPGLVAQHVEQAAVRLHVQLARFAVDGERDFHRRLRSARRVSTPTISRRYSALARTLLIGRAAATAAWAALSISSSVRRLPRSRSSACRARIGVGATAPRTMRVSTPGTCVTATPTVASSIALRRPCLM